MHPIFRHIVLPSWHILNFSSGSILSFSTNPRTLHVFAVTKWSLTFGDGCVIVKWKGVPMIDIVFSVSRNEGLVGGCWDGEMYDYRGTLQPFLNQTAYIICEFPREKGRQCVVHLITGREFHSARDPHQALIDTLMTWSECPLRPLPWHIAVHYMHWFNSAVAS